MMGTTELYRSVMEQVGDELMHQVWDPTPWMVDHYTGSIESQRYGEIRAWCRDRFGPEGWPIHGKPGDWHLGGVTFHGKTWIGFRSRDQLEEFLAEWGEEDL